MFARPNFIVVFAVVVIPEDNAFGSGKAFTFAAYDTPVCFIVGQINIAKLCPLWKIPLFVLEGIGSLRKREAERGGRKTRVCGTCELQSPQERSRDS